MTSIRTDTRTPLGGPGTLLDNDGLTVLTVHGFRSTDGDIWTIEVYSGPADAATTHGVVQVTGTTDPETAVMAALDWTAGQCRQQGMTQAAVRIDNDDIPLGERPYFAAAKVIVTSLEWS